MYAGRIVPISRLALVFGAAIACEPREEAAAPASRPARAVAVEGGESAEKAPPAGGTASELGVHPSAGPVGSREPARGAMPDDAVHAPFRPGAGTEGALPPGHPPVGGAPVAAPAPSGPGATGAAPADGPDVPIEEGVERPLPLEGSGGASELSRRLAGVSDEALRAKLDLAFRLTFTVKREMRDPERARQLLESIPREGPNGATAARILGYVAVSSGFKADEATARYQEAIDLDPGYGEAHYALAFMYVMGDREAGRKHYRKARELGVPDTRSLSRFYDAPPGSGG